MFSYRRVRTKLQAWSSELTLPVLKRLLHHPVLFYFGQVIKLAFLQVNIELLSVYEKRSALKPFDIHVVQSWPKGLGTRDNVLAQYFEWKFRVPPSPSSSPEAMSE